MIALPATMTIPLSMDEHGIIRVSGTRVTLDTLIGFYLQGQSAEALHQGFPTVPLADIHATISYYLANRQEVDLYLQQGQQAGEQLQRKLEAARTPEQKARDTDLAARMQQNRYGG